LQPVQSLPQRAWGNAYLMLVLTTLMWGGNAVASRLAVGEISPMALTSMRWIFVCAVLPYAMRAELRRYWPVLKRHRLQILLLGTFGFTAFNALMYVAAHSTTAVNIGILQGSIPVFVLLGALLCFGTPIGMLQAIGVAVTILGVVVTASQGSFETLMHLTFVPGDIWMIIACLFYAGYTVGIRNRPPVPGLVFFTTLAMVACVISLPLLGYEVATGHFIWPSWKGWLILAYVVIGPSILSQLFFMRAVELIGPGRSGVFVNLVPVFAPLLAVLILGEHVALYHGLALALVLGGIWIAERRR
jgi:drug/metabolite transporter (DMT)-like permease